ncbi:MAG: HAD-IA family hydrolase [Acidimicrobiales bacterium]
MIRAVLFDFGGVITSSPFEAFNRYEAEAGLPRDTVRTINSTNPHANAWARLERGEIDVGQFAASFEREAAGLGFTVDADAVLDALVGELRPAMVEAVRRCGEHLVTALLTNNFRSNDERPRADEIRSVMAMFDHVVESSVVGRRKPEPAFYRLACAQIGLDARECVFLDDLGVNLKPARAMGMTTIKVGDAATALAELESVVGFPLTTSGG